MTARTYTFLFTDIESSTQLLEANGAVYAEALGEHRRLLRRICAANGGDEAGTAGDAYFAVFNAADAAVNAALDAQLALRAHQWPDGCELRVRMGLHTGTATHEGGEYIGLDVHTAARVCSAAHGGQILATGVTAASAPAAEFADIGTHRLRGVSEPIAIKQVVDARLPRAFPPVHVDEEPTASLVRPTRVLIVDDQELIRTGLRMVLSAVEGVTVVGEAADGLAALDAVARCSPDVVLMDIRMPEMNGIDATRRITSQAGGPKVVILTTFDLDEYVYDALRAGASAFLLKDAPPADLVRAIQVAARGEALLAPSITRRLIAEFASRDAATTRETRAAIAGLTDREIEVLIEIARGKVNSEIAEALFISETTVKSHVRNLLTKLGARDRVQLVVAAYEAELIRPGER